MDSLKLEMKAVDELHPNLADLMDSINKVTALPPEHDSKVKVKQWLLKLGQMKAHDELTPEQVCPSVCLPALLLCCALS
jgi:ESCRT-I complex subunit VPS28